MKVTVYGSNLCSKTLHDLPVLWSKGFQVDFINITGSLGLLKEFITLRDSDPLFAETRKEGRLGTPFFVLENGVKTHDLITILNQQRTEDKLC